MNLTQEGDRLYLYSITTVAILGGLLFGYDTAVISGAEKGLEAFFLTATDFQYDKVMHGILVQCIDRLRHRRRHIRLSGLPSGATRFPPSGFRHVFPLRIGFLLSGVSFLRIRKGQLGLADCLQPLSCVGRSRRRTGFCRLSDVYRRDCPFPHPRHTGVVQPVCHYLRHARSLFRQLYDYGRPSESGHPERRRKRCDVCQPRVRHVERVRGLALYVRVRSLPGRLVRPVAVLRTQDSALSGDVR